MVAHSQTVGMSRNSIRGYDSKIKLIRDEIQWLSDYPTSSLTAAFVFLHDPISNGIFILPLRKEHIQPNSGPYALRPDHHANRAFLWAENRYYTLINFIQREKASSGRLVDLEETEELLFDQLTRLDGEKAFQWAQQRAHISNHSAVLVNTGDDHHNTQS
jgi:hypothetical protein